MVTEELLRYVEYQKNRGVDRNSIKMTLLQAGWTGDDINEAFKVVDTVSEPSTEVTPSTLESSSAKAETTTRSSTADQQVTTEPQQQPIAAEPIATESVATEATQTDSAQATTQAADQSHPQSTPSTQAGAPAEVDKPQSPLVTDIKYTRAEDWQQGKVDQTALANRLRNSSAPMTAGMVYRPTVRASVGSVDRNSPSGVAGSPKTQLSQQKNNSARTTGSRAKKAITIISGLIIVLLAAAAIYYFGFSNSKPNYDLAEVIGAFNSVEYVKFDIAGALPVSVAAADDLPPGIAALDSRDQVSVNMQGLVHTPTKKNGFGLTIDEMTFDYVYDGTSSYGKFRQLPDVLERDDLEGDWFEFSSAGQTRSLLGLVSNNPASSVTDLVPAVTTAFADLYDEGLITIEYLETVNDPRGQLDVFEINFDLTALSARINLAEQFIPEIIDYSGISTITGLVKVDSNTRLIQEINLNLSGVNGPTTLNIAFDYNYNGVEISAPPQPLPAETIVSALEAITGGAYNQIKDRLALIATDASVHLQENNSLVDFCNTKSVVEFKLFVDEQIQKSVICNSNQTGFAVASTLPNPEFYACVDIDYTVVTTKTPLPAGGINCGEPVAYEAPAVETPDQTDSSSAEITDEEFFD